ncbi:MAG: ferredoxin [Deltaproteobacteria bacterium RBG_16_48_10]|nr:MAG: ferredoxin [Deltaproteobacteria bacterium RBG_16_48_10]
MPPIIDENKCLACGVCADICPQDVFFGSENGKAPVISYPEECWHCNACVSDCPVQGAIRLRIPFPMLICYR